MTNNVVRAAALVVAMLALTSCGRQVRLQLGPISLVAGFALLEVRVWNGASCPADVRAAAHPATLDDVAVARSYTMARDAPAVGAVPTGSHAVSVVVRNAACEVVVYGCTPSVDFATATVVNIAWAATAPGLACETGLTCASGACTGTSSPRDAGGADGG